MGILKERRTDQSSNLGANLGTNSALPEEIASISVVYVDQLAESPVMDARGRSTANS
jgi:hypothetical protein